MSGKSGGAAHEWGGVGKSYYLCRHHSKSVIQSWISCCCRWRDFHLSRNQLQLTHLITTETQSITVNKPKSVFLSGFLLPTGKVSLLFMSKVKKPCVFVEVVCLQQTVVEMLKCHTRIWLLDWDSVCHKPILAKGFMDIICHEKEKLKWGAT